MKTDDFRTWIRSFSGIELSFVFIMTIPDFVLEPQHVTLLHDNLNILMGTPYGVQVTDLRRIDIVPNNALLMTAKLPISKAPREFARRAKQSMTLTLLSMHPELQEHLSKRARGMLWSRMNIIFNANSDFLQVMKDKLAKWTSE